MKNIILLLNTDLLDSLKINQLIEFIYLICKYVLRPKCNRDHFVLYIIIIFI